MRAVWLAVIFSVALLAQDANTVVISGEVTGGSGTHTIYVGLWDQASFLKTPIRGFRFDAGRRPARYSFTVPKGRWAISAYEDLNENGVLDQGLFGPKPNGFYRAFRGHHKPRFDEVAVDVERDLPAANIVLK